jgi:ribosomal protein L35
MQKRFRVCGPLRNKMFLYHAKGYKHLNRNKSRRNLRTNKNYYLVCKGDIKKAKKLLPYFRRKKFLRC